jgi:hypothetical protein
MVVWMTRHNLWLAFILGLAAACGESDSGDSGTAAMAGAGSGGVPSGSGGGVATGGANSAGNSGKPGAGTDSGGGSNAGTANTSGASSAGAEAGGAGGSDDSGAAGEASVDGGATNGSAGDGNAVDLPEQVSTVAADKIDLLFVIDNSISMADKQEIFRDAVPLLVERLVRAPLESRSSPH